MTKIIQAIKSRTTWAAVALYLVTTVPQFESVIPVEYKPIVDGILALLVVIFHIHPSQNYSK